METIFLVLKDYPALDLLTQKDLFRIQLSPLNLGQKRPQIDQLLVEKKVSFYFLKR